MTASPSDKPIVLITGASSGIGAALAWVYAAKGYDLALLARRHERLAALASEIARRHPTCTPFALRCDVASEQEVQNAVKAALQKFKRLDVVIANAGIGMGGGFKKITVEKYRTLFDTNFFGVLNTVKASLPALEESRGRLAVIGSINAYLALPLSSAYCASKAAVKALCDVLRYEFKRDQVSVTLISPGLVESEIRGENDKAPKWLVMRADKAALKIYRAVDRRRAESVLTVHGKLLVFLERHVPRLVRFIVGRF